MSNHPIVHIEISANNRKEASKFYERIFGWKITHDDQMDYSMFEYEDGRGGGFNPVSDHNPAGTVTIYIQSDDIEATLEKIEANGGKTILQKSEIPGIGWYAFFQDPTGNTLALYKSK